MRYMERLIRSWFLIIVCVNVFIFIVQHYIKSINGENHDAQTFRRSSMFDLHAPVLSIRRIDEFAVFEDNNPKEEPTLYKSKNVNINWKEMVRGVCGEFSSAVVQVGQFLTAKLIHLEDYQICKIVKYYFIPADGERVLRIGFKFSAADQSSSTVQFDTVLKAINKFLGKHSNTCKTWCMKLTGGNWVGYIKNGIDNDAWEGFGCNIHQKFGGCLNTVRSYNIQRKRTLLLLKLPER